MYIVQVVPAISRGSSGPSYTIVRLCESLIAYQQNVTLAALDWSPMTSSPSFLEVFPVGVGPRRLGRSRPLKRWLDEQVRSGLVDILHSHGMWQMSSVYPGWVAKRSRANLVVSPRGMLSPWAMRNGSWMKNLFWPLLQKGALSSATCFHATADSEYEDIRRLGFKQPVAVIPNGVDIPELPAKAEDRVRTLLFLGRIHKKKGLTVLLTAWNALENRFPQWKLVIVGDDHDYYGVSGFLRELKALTAELRLKRVEFVGELQGSAKLDAYHKASLFVLPTYSENFGMTVAEALAAGTPVISTKGAPWRGLIDHNCGWWIDIGVDPLVSSLEDALSRSHRELVEMGLRGRAWMAAEFSWTQVGRRMLETYDWLLGCGENTPRWVHTD